MAVCPNALWTTRVRYICTTVTSSPLYMHFCVRSVHINIVCLLKNLTNKAKCFAVNLLIACFNRSFFPFDQDPVWEESAQWKDVEAAVTERASAVHAAEASLLKAKYDVERKCESMLELRTRATASLGITPLNVFTGRNWTPPVTLCSFGCSLLFLVKSWQTLRLKSTSLRR